MSLFNEKTFVGWFRRGWALGFIIGILGAELVRAIIRLVQAYGGS